MLAALATWAVASVRTIEPGDFAVADAPWGGRPVLLEPGTRFVPRGLRTLRRYPAGEQLADLTGEPVTWLTPEGARLDFGARVVYRVAPDEVLRAHRAAGGAPLDTALVRPALAEALSALAGEPDAPAVGTAGFRAGVEARLAAALDERGVVLVALEDVADLPGGALRAAVPERNLLVLGLDGADWDIIDPLIARDELPHLARLAREGVRARLRTIAPILSPVVWTSVATGKLPAKHGIFDFLAAAADGTPVPVTSTLWRARPFWDVLGDGGVPVAVTAWWATWPAYPVNGALVTDRIAYQLFREVVNEPAAGDDARGKTWPQGLYRQIEPLIVRPDAIGDERLARYVDLAALGPRSADDAERLNELRTVLASTATYEAIGTELLARRPSGLHCLYNESTDTAAHLFMPFRPPRREGVDPRQARAFGGVVDAVYREADAMLGRLLERVGPGWNVLVLSDHGFKHGANRPASDPRISHGPAADWHDRFGVLVLWGPDVRQGVEVADATVLDVAPTVLALYGLPVGEDMDGRVLEQALEPAFLAAQPLRRHPSYERGERVLAAVAPSSRDADLMEKLRSLGYIGGDDASAPAGADEAGFTQDNARAHNNRGITLLQAGDLDGALAAFREGLAAGGGAQSLVNLANVHLLRDELDEAERAISRLASARADFPGLAALRGRLADRRGESERAKRLLAEAVRLDPADSRSHARLGHLLEREGRLDDALGHYRAAVRADPENAEASNYLGNVLRARGDLEGAERAYRAAVRADPKYPGGYNNLGLLLQQAGRTQEAVELYRRGLDQAPRSALLHNSLAGLLLTRGDLAQAEPLIARTLELDPGMAEAHNNLGILRAMQGRAAEARDQFEQALELDPRNVDAHFNLAKALLLERDLAGALDRFARALELEPRHLEAALGAGEIAYRTGGDDAAVRYFEQARGIDPSIARVRRTLGELYLRRGDRRRAATEWRAALELDPDQPELRRRLEQLDD